MSGEQQRYGVWSDEAVTSGAVQTHWYTRAGSTELVEVIGVTGDPKLGEYGWPDAVNVGPVGRWVQAGRSRIRNE